MLLSTVLEKVVMVLVVVVELGARILQKDTRVNVISFTRRASLSLLLCLLCRVASSLMSFFASDISEEKIMRYKVGTLARSLARLPVVANSFDAR